MVQYLVKQGHDVNVQDKQGVTALMLAIKMLNVKTIKILTNNNADIYAMDSRGVSSLLYAFQNCITYWTYNIQLKQYRQLVVLNILFEQMNKDFLADKDKMTKMILDSSDLVKFSVVIFGNIELVEIILENGYPVDFQEPMYRCTALHIAIIFGKIDNAKLLIAYGANPNALDKIDRSPIYYYTWNFESIDEDCLVLGNLLIRSIYSSSDKKYRTDDIEALLEYGQKKSIVRALKIDKDLAQMRFRDDKTCLHLLIANRNEDVLEIYDEFDIEFDPNIKDSDGDTPLMTAARSRSSLRKFEFLLKNGGDIQYSLSSALLIATFGYMPKRIEEDEVTAKILDILLQYGANAQFVYYDSTLLSVLSFVLDRSVKLTSKIIMASLALDEAINASYMVAPHSRKKLDDYPLIKLFYHLYSRQLDDMKNTVIDNRVTLFELLTGKMEKIVNYARNRDFVKALRNVIKCDRYCLESYYMYTLQNRIDSAIEKVKLDERAAAKIEDITGVSSVAYHVVVYRIIGYLSKQDLLSLCKV